MTPIEITVMDNGPNRVSGQNIVLKDSSGKTWNLAGKPGIALCRCGQSANKPFCDGSHGRTGFQSKCTAQ